jgi:hypothetical protein
MDYAKFATLITKDNALYKISFTDGTEEYARLYVRNTGFYNCPCLSGAVGDAHAPYPFHKLNKVASVTLAD